MVALAAESVGFYANRRRRSTRRAQEGSAVLALGKSGGSGQWSGRGEPENHPVILATGLKWPVTGRWFVLYGGHEDAHGRPTFWRG
jgi:hypothetical protein